jgi:Ni/Fe-hydrogenase subunit HybB-like protein
LDQGLQRRREIALVLPGGAGSARCGLLFAVAVVAVAGAVVAAAAVGAAAEAVGVVAPVVSAEAATEAIGLLLTTTCSSVDSRLLNNPCVDEEVELDLPDVDSALDCVLASFCTPL